MSIEGLDNAVQNLRKFSEDALKLRRPALEAGALIIQNGAKYRVLVDTHDLQRAIHYEAVEETPTRVIVVVGPTVPYGRRIELGYSGTDSKGRTYNQPPHPYLRPAYEENKNKVEQEVFDVFELLKG